MAKTKQTQIDKFKQAARDLEADDSEKHFNEKLSKIARQKPSDPKQPPSSGKK
jgi:pyruvate-formate lyase